MPCMIDCVFTAAKTITTRIAAAMKAAIPPSRSSLPSAELSFPSLGFVMDKIYDSGTILHCFGSKESISTAGIEYLRHNQTDTQPDYWIARGAHEAHA